jgi:PcaR/PcaU/PobR family beta-ketoadipate pathway transcriptional regulator
MPDERYFIEALHRGLRVLEAFTEEGPAKKGKELSLVQIADAVNLDKSTAFRFVYTLQELGYLERDEASKRYRPGLKLLELGFTALERMDLVRLAEPHLAELARETGEAVNMAVRDHTEIVYVAHFSSTQVVAVNMRVGARLPLHCSSLGKAQLLDHSAEALRELLGPGPYEARTAHTLTTPDELLADLEVARWRGYTVSDEELVVGARSLAAPIRNREGQIVAAVNVSVSSARFSKQELEEHYAHAVLEVARHISRGVI